MPKKPIYQEIYDFLAKKILTGELAVGEQVPTEQSLAQSFHTSRITSKRALTDLENKGLVERIQGKGTFVKAAGEHVPQQPQKKILFLSPFPNQHDLGNFTAGMLPYLTSQGYQLHIQDDTYLTQPNFFELIDQYDGMIYYPLFSNSNLAILYQLAYQKFPIVLLDKKVEELDLPLVTADNFGGVYTATKRLLQTHERIAFLHHTPLGQISTVRQRYLGYLQALLEAGQSFQTAPNTDASQDDAALLQSYLDNGVSAVIAENDLVAIHFMKVAKQAGINIPEQLSIVGFDNIQAASLVEPALSTISQDFLAMGEAAASMLLQVIAKKEPANVEVPVQWIERESHH